MQLVCSIGTAGRWATQTHNLLLIFCVCEAVSAKKCIGQNVTIAMEHGTVFKYLDYGEACLEA